MLFPSYGLGATSAGIVSLETIGVPWPSKAAPARYAKYVKLGDRQTRGMGELTTTWRFVDLDEIGITALRTYCSGSSAAVYMRTLAEDMTYKVYAAIMTWDQSVPQVKAGMHVDVAIEFSAMVAV
jgi:hypothetical protein